MSYVYTIAPYITGVSCAWQAGLRRHSSIGPANYCQTIAKYRPDFHSVDITSPISDIFSSSTNARLMTSSCDHFELSTIDFGKCLRLFQSISVYSTDPWIECLHWRNGIHITHLDPLNPFNLPLRFSDSPTIYMRTLASYRSPTWRKNNQEKLGVPITELVSLTRSSLENTSYYEPGLTTLETRRLIADMLEVHR